MKKDEKRILIFSIVEHQNKNQFSHMVRFLNEKQTSKIFKKNQINIIESFICNFLDFLNHPDVETKIIKWGTNESRIRRGKLPIPDKVKINIKGKLYRYIYEDLPRQTQHKSFSHSFWVRGHYIHFWNKKRWKKLYSLELDDLKEKGYQISNGIISKWKLPFIKGKGILLSKPYKLKKK